jgi:hypothetical protein
LKDFFETLNRTRTPYVVLRDWPNLPDRWLDRDRPIVMLVDQMQDFMQLGGVTKLNGYMYYTNLTIAGQEQRQLLEVYPKGAGLFPERFESDLLSKWELHNGIVKIVQQPYATYSALYMMLYKDKIEIPEDFRRVFDSFIKERIGLDTTSQVRAGKARKLTPRPITPAP